MSSDSHWTDHDPYPEPEEEDRRPSSAERYPADRAFFLGEDSTPRSRRQAAGIVADADHEESFGDGYDDAPVESDYQDGGFDDQEPDDEFYESGTPAYGDDDEEAGDETWQEDSDLAEEDDQSGYQAPAGAARPGSVAASAAASGRRIRFDPTQERGSGQFERAHRHSRRVRYLKVILPGAAILGILVFLGFVQFAPSLDGTVVEMSGVDFEANKVTMRTPQISGFEGTKQAYKITAREAVQDLGNPDVVALHDIAAEVGIGDGNVATIKATTGSYNRKRELLFLEDGITLNTTDGQSAVLEKARVSVKKGQISSDTPVELNAKDLSVKANEMVIEDRGKHIMFRNGVKVTYHPPAEPEPAAAAEPAEAAVAQNGEEGL